ncbi:MAG: hypothetical protein JKY19_11200 [Alcanivoracaceae bacterium]|nr:hypothetical protein [Alcanivoracaceae bacterium]
MTNDIDKALASSFIAISKLIKEFNVDLNSFCRGLRKYHILETSKSNETVACIALITGVDRRTASGILNNKSLVYKPSSLSVILNRIETVANSNNKLVNKKGINSVESIMHEVASGATTLKSIIVILLRLGCIEDQYTQIKFISNQLKMTADKQKALEGLSAQLEKYIDKIIQAYKT